MIKKSSFCKVVWILVWSSGASVLGMDHKYCDDLSPQSHINLELLMGVWFGVEYITHSRDSLQQRIEFTDTCFHIDIKEINREMTPSSYYQASTPQYEYGPRPRGDGGLYPERRYRHLVLEWDEPGNVMDYPVKLNISRPGFWLSAAPVYGARIADMYKHFAGTIQVLKAVNNHLVLSFCQRLPDRQLFTVVLARQPQQLDQGELIGIHNLLSMKQLSTSAVRKVCSGAHAQRSAIAALVATLAAALISFVLSHEA